MTDPPPTVGRLPVPLYQVLKEELGAVLPGSSGSGGNVQGAWDLQEGQILCRDRLEEAWQLLELDKLHAEVAGREQGWQQQGQEFVVSLVSSLYTSSRMVQNAAKRFKRLSFLGSLKTESSRAPLTERVKQLNALIRAPACLYQYKRFPKEMIGKSARDLAKTTRISGIFICKLVLTSHISIKKIVKAVCQSIRELAQTKEKSIRKIVRSVSKSIEELALNLQEKNQREDDLRHVNRLLLEELLPDHIMRIHDLRLEEVYAGIHGSKSPLSALCLSGGGIRSATFSLGVLQGLAREGLLGQFHYLSTVSGGGYIGSWLSAWYHHRDNDTQKVDDELKCEQAQSPTRPEPKVIRHLRAYSNYLTPRLGLLSADTWVLIGTYFRNLLLNWLVFIPVLLAVCAVPRMSVSMVHFRTKPQLMDIVMDGLLWAGLLAATWAVAYAAAARPGVRRPSAPDAQLREARARESVRHEGQGNFIRWCLIPLCASATLLTTFWLWYYRPGHQETSVYINSLIHWPTTAGPNWRNYLVLGVVVHGLGWLLGFFWRVLKTKTLLPFHWLLAEAGAGIAEGLLLWLAARLAYVYLPLAHESSIFYILYTCLASPLYLSIFLLSVALFSGLCSYRQSDEDREWSARLGAWVLIALTVWAGFSTWILFGPLVFYQAAALAGSVGGISGLITVLLGHSGKTAANQKAEGTSGKVPEISHWLLAAAAPLFLSAILACLSLMTSGLIYLTVIKKDELWRGLSALIRHADFSRIAPWDELGYLEIILKTPWRLELFFIAVMALIGVVASGFINLNKFSLHAVYRNRLVRAYLGASNARRKPNIFTGFDPDDNIALTDLRSPPHAGTANATQRPLHIVNMALNLVGGKNLTWQQRKAATFTSSKFHTGNYHLGYRPTALYARKGHQGKGLTLGTAMTISGAAANSNMGYHSSPLVCFLMTLFNVRLGCWLGNPGPAGQDSFPDPAPQHPAYYEAKEALGLTDDTSRFVFLSDGGHFENLGLYEMILRRCKLIVVCDAGCDPACALEDLGNAIRKIRADLGVNIDIKPFDIYSRNNYRYKKPKAEEIGKYCAIGTIDYAEVDKPPLGSRALEKGTLVYLKPALCGTEPKDVFNYKEKSPCFPHESTVDQFFSESQFESYRALGLHVVKRIYQDDQGFPRTLDGFHKQVSYYVQETPTKTKP
jgi:hypothetical protein